MKQQEHKLELKHIAPYLPYGLMVMRPDGNTILPCDGILGTLIQHRVKDHIEYSSLCGCKPILRPLSDLDKPCLEGERVPMIELAKKHIEYDEANKDSDIKVEYFFTRQTHVTVTWKHPISNEPLFDDRLFIQTIPERIFLNTYWVNEYLSENHFDIFGLIEKGLAIDANTINKK